MMVTPRALRNALKTLAAICCLLIPPASALGQTRTAPATTKPIQIQAGEEFTYQAEFSRALLRGVDVGEFKFASSEGQFTPKEAAPDDPISALQLTGDIVSKGFFVRLFGVRFHEQIDSTVDRAGMTLLQTRKHDEQNKRVRNSEATFDHRSRKVTWTERDPNNPAQPARVVSAEFTEPVQDVLSGIFFLRTLPLASGKSFEIVVSDSGRVVHVPIVVSERKRMKTVLGQVNTLRVEPDVFGEGGLIRGPGRLTIWVTNDSQHIPVRAQIKVDLGTFEIKLKRYKSAAH